MRIAITGGIGSGKSFVCRRLSERGIVIYDCDNEAKRLMQTSDELRQRLKMLVGKGLYADGVLDKAMMARFILASEDNTKAVNAIVHPAVAGDFLSSGCEWMECAILFESGFDRLVDMKVCVTAPHEVRVSRIMQRDGITREKAEQWIGLQMPQEEVVRRCDLVITNDGKEDIDKQINKIINELNDNQDKNGTNNSIYRR